MEIGVACATFGLIMGGVVGGPLAKFLISRFALQPATYEPLSVGVPHDEADQKISVHWVLNAVLVICIAIGVGLQLNSWLQLAGLRLPTFVTCLFAGILLTNSVPLLFRRLTWPTGTPTLALISELCLGLFLAMSLMSLKLWTLLALAGPILLL